MKSHLFHIVCLDFCLFSPPIISISALRQYSYSSNKFTHKNDPKIFGRQKHQDLKVRSDLVVRHLAEQAIERKAQSISHNFDEIINRTETLSLKWDRHKDSDVLPLWVADMDFRTSPEIICAVQDRITHGVFGYTVPDKDIKAVVTNYLWDKHQLLALPEWVFFLPGLVQGMNLACRVCSELARQDNELGSEPCDIFVFTPIYPPFLSAPGNSGNRCICIPLVRAPVSGSLTGRVDWTFDWSAMEAAITPRTKMVMLCNPHNPVGRVFTRAELEKLSEFCLKHDLIVCSDEIHCDMIYDPETTPHVSFSTLNQEIAERTITLHSPSKTYNIPSMGIAYAVIPNKRIRRAFIKAASGLVTQMPAVGYTSLKAAYTESESWRRHLMMYLDANRKLLYNFVETRLPELKIWPMEATYLAWIDTTGLQQRNPWQFFLEAGVGLSDGKDFGDSNFVRINFGCPAKVLEEALIRMEKAIVNNRST